MSKFTVYFQIYEKKLRTTVDATDELHAMDIVKSSISVIKVRKEPEIRPEKKKSALLDDIDNIFQDILDLFPKKK